MKKNILKYTLSALFFMLLMSFSSGLVYAQMPVCTELARVGWYEFETVKNDNSFYFNLIKTLRTDNYKDFGVASKFLGTMQIPIADFLVPFNFSSDTNGWAKFRETSESYLYEKIESNSQYYRQTITINPAVIDLVRSCINQTQNGVFITLGKSISPDELPFVVKYVGVPGLPNVSLSVRSVQNNMSCGKSKFNIEFNHSITFTCLRKTKGLNKTARLDFNVNKSNIITDSTWSLPAAGTPNKPPSVVAPVIDPRKVNLTAFCFNTTDEDKDGNTMVAVDLIVNGAKNGSWFQTTNTVFPKFTDNCFPLNGTQPISLSNIQEGKVQLNFGINSMVGKDDWNFAVHIKIRIDGEASDRDILGGVYHLTRENERRNNAWIIPKLDVAPFSSPQPVPKSVEIAPKGKKKSKTT